MSEDGALLNSYQVFYNEGARGMIQIEKRWSGGRESAGRMISYVERGSL